MPLNFKELQVCHFYYPQKEQDKNTNTLHWETVRRNEITCARGEILFFEQFLHRKLIFDMNIIFKQAMRGKEEELKRETGELQHKGKAVRGGVRVHAQSIAK